MVPEGWTRGVFEDGIELISGQHVEAEYVNDSGVGKPYLTGPADFPNGKIIVSKFTSEGKKFSQKDDLLITVKGSGTGKVIESDDSYAISRQLMAIRPQKFNHGFVFYNLLASISRYEGAAAGLIPGISRDDVLHTPILIPPLPEQKKIAQILSTWDKAITTTEQLLANSQQQKKALMQQLLTGKKRLLDKNGVRFSGEWSKIAIGKIIKEIKKEKEVNPNSIELLTVKLHYKGVTRSGKFPNATERGRPYFRRYKGELIIGRQNLHHGGIAIVSDECNGLIASNAISSFEARKGVDINFILSLMSTEHFRFTVDNLAGGTGQKEIGVKDLLSLSLVVPDFEEQKKIAAVLFTADQEITALQQKLDAFKQEKKALMQQLLTGKRRVQIN